MKTKPTAGAPLTPSEREVLILIAKGYTNAEIALALGRQIHTINDHVKAVYAKVDVDRRAEAAVRACEMGLHGTPAPVREELPEPMVSRILLACGHTPGTHIDAPTLMKFANRLAAEVRGATGATQVPTP